MTVAEALGQLGLPEGATREEIEDAYLSAMRQVHHDSDTPDADRLVKLNSARDVAIAAVQAPGAALVRLSDVTALVQLAVRAPTEQAVNRATTREAVAQVVMLHRGRLEATRRRQFALAFSVEGAAVVAALLVTVVARTRVADPGSDGTKLVALAEWQSLFLLLPAFIAAAGGVIALSAFLAKSSIEWLERSIEESASALGDRHTFVRTLQELELPNSWTTEELRSAVRTWSGGGFSDTADPFLLRRSRRLTLGVPLPGRRLPSSVPLREMARYIGNVDFSRLLLTKGTEIELLVEEPATGDDGMLEFRFRLPRPGEGDRVQ